jgi:hypothetical protein
VAKTKSRKSDKATDKEVAKTKMTFHLQPATAKRIRVWAAEENLSYSEVIEVLVAGSPVDYWVSRRYRSSGPDVAGHADGADGQAA